MKIPVKVVESASSVPVRLDPNIWVFGRGGCFMIGSRTVHTNDCLCAEDEEPDENL